MKTHYSTLGVHKSATDMEVKFAYGQLALMCHPDLHDNNPEKAAQMAELNVAYNVLKKIDSRKEYDKLMAILHKKCAQCQGKGAVMKQKGFNKKIAVACAACEGSGLTEK